MSCGTIDPGPLLGCGNGLWRPIRVMVNNLACITSKLVQFRKPKSKSKRIRNKWFKDPKNWKLKEVHRVIWYGDTMYVSQHVFDSISANVGDSASQISVNHELTIWK